MELVGISVIHLTNIFLVIVVKREYSTNLYFRYIANDSNGFSVEKSVGMFNINSSAWGDLQPYA